MPTADTDRQRLKTFLFYGIIILLGYMVFCVARPFLIPLAWAGILTLCTQPLYNRFARKLRPSVSAALVTVLVALVLIVPAVFFVFTVVGEASQATAGIQGAIEQARNSPRLGEIWTKAQAYLPLPSMDEMKVRLVASSGKFTAALASQTGAILQNVAAFIFLLFVMLIALFFFLKDSHAIVRGIRSILPFEESRKDKLLMLTRQLIYASVITMLSVACIQGIIACILFAVLGLEAPVFWGFMVTICSFIPLVGTALIWVPAAIWFFVHAAWAKGIVLLLGGFFLISGVDNVLRPLIMSGRTSMNVLIMLISVLGGLLAFGFVGVVLGPVVIATAMSLLSLDVAEEEKPK
jgi:predicted PurR-regulated permease PerM